MCGSQVIAIFQFSGSTRLPQNFNQEVELQKIEKIKKYFAEVIVDGFPP